MRISSKRSIVAIAALVSIVGACGDDDDDDAATTTGAVEATSPTGDSSTATIDTGAAGSDDTAAAPVDVTPVTVGPETTAGEKAPASLTPDEQAVADVYRTVISSEGPAVDKLALVEGGQQLRKTLDSYLAAAKTVNGIDVTVTNVDIAGEKATLTYDLMLAGSPTYPDQEGRVAKADGEWMVPRDEFCTVVSHVPGVACPS